MDMEFIDVYQFIREAEQRGWVTRTFRRLDPDRQGEVIKAIIAEAAESGPSEMNIRRVAEKCDVAVGSLYQYFGSRAKLLDFAIELMVRATSASFEAYSAYLASLPLKDALTQYLGGGIEWAEEQSGMARMFAKAAYQGTPELSDRVVRPIATILTNMVKAILQAAQQRGEIRDDIDLDAMSRLVNVAMIAIGDARLFGSLNDYYQLYIDSTSYESILSSFFQLLETGLMSGRQP
jgi:TetR/AcrR family transcriptional regulator